MKLNAVVLKRVAAGVAAAIALAFIGAVLFASCLKGKGVPDYGKDLVLDGLRDEVTVYRDRYAVPHIYAKNEHDLYLATGYCMAQERLWQMDLIRRATQGRLSEIFGEEMVDVDLLLRALRIEAKSMAVMARTDAAVTAAGMAFCDGVNQYIRKNRGNLPLEFTILGYEPEEWKPVHSVNLIGYMAWDLTMPWGIETVLDQVRRKVGDGLFDDIVPHVERTRSSIYGRGGVMDADREYANVLFASMNVLEDMGLTVFNASNNWAVSGTRSASGKPLLSNDMHLGLNAPGIWMQMHQCVEGKDGGEPLLDVTGVAVPGAPFVVSGHNRKIAWGMTNVMIDDMDFFMEKTDPGKPDKYLYRGQWRDMEVRKETIRIKGGRSAEKKLRFTVHGPVISEFRNISDAVVTMHWVGNYFSNEVETMYRLNRASDWESFKAALRTFRALSQNIAYADVKGNIGIYCASAIPIRKKGNGMGLVPGWTDEYEWSGFVPFEQQPSLYNPPSGMVVSANNRTSPTFPHYVSRWYYPPYRYDRIVEMIREKEKLTVEDYTRMHNDRKSALVALMKPGIVAVAEKMSGLNELELKALDLLRQWDGTMDRDSAAAALFEQFYYEFIVNTFRDRMGEELFDKYTSERVTIAYAIEQLWGNHDSGWFDDPATKDRRETFDDVAAKSFRGAVARLEALFSGNTKRWRWGELHTLTLKHPLGSVAVLDLLLNLNRGPYQVGGSYHTVCPYSYKPGKPFKSDDGASQRHAYDLADWDRSLTVIPTGTSGIAGSRHYCDQTDLYVNGRYHPDYFTREKVIKNAAYTMKFVKK